MTTEHTPWPTLVDIVEDVGGVYITIDQEIQLRCGCRDDLSYDYGHAPGETLTLAEVDDLVAAVRQRSATSEDDRD